MNNFAHKATFNTVKGAYAAGDAVATAAKATKFFGANVLVGIKAGYVAAKAARNPATGNTGTAVVVLRK